MLSGEVWFFKGWLADAYVKAGDHKKAEAICSELSEDARRGAGLELGVAMAHDALGRSAEAMDWLEKAYDAKSPMMCLVGIDFMSFNSVQGDPRFVARLTSRASVRPPDSSVWPWSIGSGGRH